MIRVLSQAPPPPLPHPIPDPEAYLPDSAPSLFALLGVALLLAATAVFFWVKRPTRRELAASPKRLPFLEDLQAKASAVPLAQVASACSLALRRELLRIHRLPLLYQTRYDHELPPSLPPEIGSLLAELDAHRYAPSDPSPEGADLVDRTKKALNQLRSRPPSSPR